MRHGFIVTEAALHIDWKLQAAAKMLDVSMAQDPGIADAMIFKLQPEAAQAIRAAGPQGG